jgi:hypothetical protein
MGYYSGTNSIGAFMTHEVTYKNTAEDHMRYYTHFGKNALKEVYDLRACVRTREFTVFSVIVFALFIAAGMNHISWFSCVVIVLLLGMLLRGRIASNRMLEWQLQHEDMSPRTVRLDDSGILIENALWKRWLAWEVIEKAEVLKDYVMVYWTGRAGLMIPCQFFETDQKREAFVQALQHYLAKKTLVDSGRKLAPEVKLSAAQPASASFMGGMWLWLFLAIIAYSFLTVFAAADRRGAAAGGERAAVRQDGELHRRGG